MHRVWQARNAGLFVHIQMYMFVMFVMYMLNNQKKERTLEYIIWSVSSLLSPQPPLHPPPAPARFVGSGGGVMVKTKRWHLVLNWSLLCTLLAAFPSKCGMYMYRGCSYCLEYKMKVFLISPNLNVCSH